MQYFIKQLFARVKSQPFLEFKVAQKSALIMFYLLNKKSSSGRDRYSGNDNGSERDRNRESDQ